MQKIIRSDSPENRSLVQSLMDEGWRVVACGHVGYMVGPVAEVCMEYVLEQPAIFISAVLRG